MTTPVKGTNKGRARANERRAARGLSPKPTPAQLRLIEANAIPPSHRTPRLNLKPRFRYHATEVRAARALVRRSGVLRYLDSRLHDHVGSKSIIRAEVLVVGSLLCAADLHTAKRTDLTKVIGSLDAHSMWSLGLTTDATGWRPPSYRAVAKQLKRLQDALEAGWVAEDGTVCDLGWYSTSLIRASIPEFRRASITDTAIDGTASPTWARWRPSKRHVDPMVEYQRLLADDPDTPEPVLRPRKAASRRIGSIGPDGRKISSKDPDAREGWATATSSSPGRVYCGFEVHTAVSARSCTWAGDHRNAKLGDAVPAYILGAHVTEGGAYRGDAGLEVINRAMAVAPTIDEVIVDRGYSHAQAERFRRPLHVAGINVVMDYQKRVAAKPHRFKVTQGSREEQLWMQAGTFFHLSIPDKLFEIPADIYADEIKKAKRKKGEQIQPLEAEDEEDIRKAKRAAALAARLAFGERVKTYRWSELQRLSGGAIRFRCPICAGRAVNTELNPASASNPYSAREVATPDGLDRCCHGTLTIPVDQLDQYQRIPWQTQAWEISYGRRNVVESDNAALKSHMAMRHGWIRAFGAAAHTMGVVHFSVAWNMRLAERDQDHNVVDAEARHLIRLDINDLHGDAPTTVRRAVSMVENGSPPTG